MASYGGDFMQADGFCSQIYIQYNYEIKAFVIINLCVWKPFIASPIFNFQLVNYKQHIILLVPKKQVTYSTLSL